jgi:hypothetical protein
MSTCLIFVFHHDERLFMYQPPNQPPYDQPPPYQQPPMQPMYSPLPLKRSWYASNVGIIVLLVLFFPVGLFLMWRYATWGKTAKWVVTGFFAFVVIVNGASHGQASSQPVTVTPTQIAQHQSQVTPTSKPTQAPTPAPPTPPSRAQVDSLANSQNDVVSSYDQNTGTLVAEMDYGYKVALSQDVVKTTLQDMQKTFWKSKFYFASVTTNVMQYQPDGTLTKIAYATLKYQTASKIDFSFVVDLWDKYDEKWIDPSIENY